MNFSNLIALILGVVSILFVLMSALLLVLWIYLGGGSIIFPGLGIIVSIWGLAVFLMFLSIILVIIAAKLKH